MRRVRLQELGVAQFDRTAPADRPHHPRHWRRAAAAAADMAGMFAIDAVERQCETVGVAFAADLAVADDIDAGPFHLADREDRRIVLRLFEPGLGDAPDVTCTDPRHAVMRERRAVDQPIGLRIATDHRGRDQMRRIGHGARSSRSFVLFPLLNTGKKQARTRRPRPSLGSCFVDPTPSALRDLYKPLETPTFCQRCRSGTSEITAK
jgi:hypothetical protein